MGRIRSWLNYVKQLFIPARKPKAEISLVQKTLHDTTEEQRKHALTVALATAAAAEAAVASAKFAATVFREANARHEILEIKNSAAIKIQSAYRAYLARKALSALKGLVKIQAMIRGEIARRRLIAILKCMIPFPNSLLHIQLLRAPILDDSRYENQKKLLMSQNDITRSRELKQLRFHVHGTRDFNVDSNKDVENLWPRKQEAIVRRKRIKKYYSSSPRGRRNGEILLEPLAIKEDQGGCRFNQWTESNLLSKIAVSNSPRGGMNQMKQVHGRHARNQDLIDEPTSTPPRRLLSPIRQKICYDSSPVHSPTFPNYMTDTESERARVRARARSRSTPRQQSRFYDDYPAKHSPYSARCSRSLYTDEMSARDGNTRITDIVSMDVQGFYCY
ncbi:protein IQ-DOMAIN 14 [Ipomoea triloba]|uniref:protein IQ-DOMAIN 14 n=1 Tax=Ipomoea triloba TaxID=35885 RepID=UPI00125E8292|nr:protein IQ-DOMAIN 14 [Ipomoea triloba]